MFVHDLDFSLVKLFLVVGFGREVCEPQYCNHDSCEHQCKNGHYLYSYVSQLFHQPIGFECLQWRLIFYAFSINIHSLNAFSHHMISPALTLMSCPVILHAASEHRKRMRLATSSCSIKACEKPSPSRYFPARTPDFLRSSYIFR